MAPALSNPSVSRRQPPVVSVIVVSDYGAGRPRAWQDVRRILSALARQDFTESSEFLLVESAELDDEIPPDLTGILPGLRIVTFPDHASYELKNEGARQAAGDFLAMIDADCAPERDWLRRIVEVLRRHPEAAAVSGRTTYGRQDLMARLLSLLTRSYLDPGRAGRSQFVSNNNAGWRREPRLRYPLPSKQGPFSARVQSEALLRAGGVVLFDPSIRVVHEFEGWAMEADMRRNIGYGTVLARLRNRELPFAWLARWGRVAIPCIAAGKTLNAWADCLRCGPAYGVRWYQLPLAMLLAVALQLMEIPGMWDAYRGHFSAATAYR